MAAQTGHFENYLKSRSAGKGAPHTHTRIGGGKNSTIYGGTFNIPDCEESSFMDAYYQHVFVDGHKEYLTEKQLIEKGPVLIDIDLRYDKSVTSKQHTDDHVLDVVVLYADKCSEILNIPDGSKVDVFVMEKNDVNQLDEKTKDGIHIIMAVSMHKAAQIVLRNKVLEDISDIWDDLPITNTWEDVLDEGVTKGCVNWQIYGSRKPDHQSYRIKYHYVLTRKNHNWKPSDNKVKKFDTKKNIHRLSARYTSHPQYDIHPDALTLVEEAKNNIGRKKLSASTKKKHVGARPSFDKIDSMETLDALLDDWFDGISPVDYKLKETHQYTMALPASYYGPGSYSNWMRVGWALASTHKKMFLTWLKFSAQDNCRDTLRGNDGKFDWSNVSVLFQEWLTFDFDNPDGLTHRSIMYWCKLNAEPGKYEEINVQTIDFFVQQTLDVNQGTEFDLASVLFNLYKDRFVCVSIKNNCWYEYENHRWFEIDSGNTLRLHISQEMHKEYVDRIQQAMRKLDTLEPSEPDHEKLKKRVNGMIEICGYLKKTQWKNNIMREARELFFDKDFITKLDQNPYLLCFSNYVVDFKNKSYRRGQPDDFISKCTNIDYVPLDHAKHAGTMQEINQFIDELFPNPELRKYMWEHLASVLVGTNENQTFNIYTGSGRNGKSKLVDLMTKGLGDYKGTVPITLITQSRTSIGSTSSEIVQLMGTRYAVMQEPSKGDKINEGIMKEITGGDPIQGRALFKDTVTFIPQFKLVVCTNTLFDIKSNDDGTWRRIRVCDFMSKFLEKPYEDEEKFPKDVYPHQYPIDKNIDARFDEWAPILMSMLVNKSFESQGNVNDCKLVMASSDLYREGQDYLAEFVKDKIRKKPGSKVKKSEVSEEFKQWYTTNYGRAMPKVKEIYEFIDARFGKCRSGGWSNIAIVYDEDDEENIIDEC